MPLITEALDYFIRRKPDIADGFLSALRKILHDEEDMDDEETVDVFICRILYIITSFCETVKTTYSTHPAAEEIFFSRDLKNVTVNQLRNYLYHDFLIPEKIELKLALKEELLGLLSQIEGRLNKSVSFSAFSENTFLRKIDKILLKRHKFDHIGGQNVFLQVHNIEELCTSFSAEIYSIKPFKTTVRTNINTQNENLSTLIFGNKGYFSILNNIEKANSEFERPLKIEQFSFNLKTAIGNCLTLWAETFLNSADNLTKIPKKMALGLQKAREILSGLSESCRDFQHMRYSEISVFLSKQINESTNCVQNLGPTFKTKAFMQMVDILQIEREPLFEILSIHTDDEAEQRMLAGFISGLTDFFSSIKKIQQEQFESKKDKDHKDHYYNTELQNAFQALYKIDPNQYKKLIQYLTRAITIQPSWCIPDFLKKCLDLIITAEDNNHRNDAREALLLEICFNQTRIMNFIKIFGKLADDQKSIHNNKIPFFGCEMYLITSMNTCLKTIENIELMSSDSEIQETIAQIREQLNMRNHVDIKGLRSPLDLSFFEFISSYAGKEIGIGLPITDFRHDTTEKTFKKRKENIKQLYVVYAAFKESTAYHSPENVDMLNSTDLYKIRTEKTTFPTGFNQAKKISDLCFNRFLLTYRLNMIVAQEELKDNSIDVNELAEAGEEIEPKCEIKI